MNPEPIILAIAGAITAYFSYKASRHAKSVDKKTDTNHGREPWEYLEMVMEVRDELMHVREDMLAVKKGQFEWQREVRRGQEDLQEALIIHTATDSENFEALADLIKGETE